MVGGSIMPVCKCESIFENISVGTAFTIDNISYCVTSENEVAVYNAKGEIVKIPDQIVYNGNDYLVTAVIYKYIDDSNRTSWSGVSIVNFGKIYERWMNMLLVMQTK